MISIQNHQDRSTFLIYSIFFLICFKDDYRATVWKQINDLHYFWLLILMYCVNRVGFEFEVKSAVSQSISFAFAAPSTWSGSTWYIIHLTPNDLPVTNPVDDGAECTFAVLHIRTSTCIWYDRYIGGYIDIWVCGQNKEQRQELCM